METLVNLRGIGLIGNVYGGGHVAVSAPGILHELERFFEREADKRMTILTDGPANITIERIGGNIYLTFVRSDDNERIDGLTDLFIRKVEADYHYISEKEKIGHVLGKFFAGRVGKSALILTNGPYGISIRREEESFFFSILS